YIAMRNISDNGHALMLGEFMVSVLEENDVQLKDLTISRFNETEEDIIVSITLRNMRVNTVSTVNIEWTDSEDTYTEEFSNLDLSTLEEVELTLDSVLNYSSSGQREITVTAIDVNGEDDDNPDDNEVSD